MRTIKLELDKIDKTKVFVSSKTGKKYLDLVCYDNRDGRDKYGYDGFVAHSVTQEERENGIRGAIIGNWKEIVGLKGIAQKAKESVQVKSTGAQWPESDGPADDDIPF